MRGIDENTNPAERDSAPFIDPAQRRQVVEVQPEPIVPPGIDTSTPGSISPDFAGPIAPPTAASIAYEPHAPDIAAAYATAPHRRRGSVVYFLLALLIFGVALTTALLGHTAFPVLVLATPPIILLAIVALFTMRR